MLKENIFGLNVYYGEVHKILSNIDETIKFKDENLFIVSVNPEKTILANEDRELKKIINYATYQIPDGIGVVIASKIKKGKIKKRITGIDLMLDICSLASSKQYTIYLYGSEKEILNLTKEKLVEMYPNIKIVGSMDGFCNDNNEVLKDINLVKPDIVFVALGSPKQERWIYENMNKIDSFVFQGVGGSFDVISGKINRSPYIIRKIGLEWLYRLFREPKRLKRQLRLFRFLLLFLKYRERNSDHI